jgi:hypothetical protein
MHSVTRKLCGSEYILFKFCFSAALFLSGLNALSSSIPNNLGQRVSTNSQPLTIFGRYRPHPNINTLVNHAECSLLSYFSASEIVKALRARDGISNVRVQQRDLPEVAGTYSLIQYYEYDERTCTDEIRRVIAIAGSRNVRNMQGNMDTAMEIDDLLGMKVHRGYKSVYEAVLIDF